MTSKTTTAPKFRHVYLGNGRSLALTSPGFADIYVKTSIKADGSRTYIVVRADEPAEVIARFATQAEAKQYAVEAYEIDRTAD